MITVKGNYQIINENPPPDPVAGDWGTPSMWRTAPPTKCPKNHKLKVIGHSACDDICKCKCGKWFRCGLGAMWRKDD